MGAERELKEAWKKIDRTSLQRSSAQDGSTWVFGPADNPWHQEAVESLVKAAKRAIHFSVSNQRLSVPEFLTVCSEVSNLLNERPIGVKPSEDSIINVLTPNLLLLGRATASNPLGWQPYETNTSSRYHLVQSVVEDFWKRWTELYAPTLLVQRKWHAETQFAPRRCSNRGGQEHAKRRLSLGACERGVSRRRWKSAKSGYPVQELSNWGESS